MDLLFAFRERLDSTDQLCACGYSFRDAHVNHLIYSWLARARGRRLVVIDPNLDQDGVLDRLYGDQRWEGDSVRDRVVVRQVKASDWVREAFGDEKSS